MFSIKKKPSRHHHNSHLHIYMMSPGSTCSQRALSSQRDSPGAAGQVLTIETLRRGHPRGRKNLALLMPKLKSRTSATKKPQGTKPMGTLDFAGLTSNRVPIASALAQKPLRMLTRPPSRCACSSSCAAVQRQRPPPCPARQRPPLRSRRLSGIEIEK